MRHSITELRSAKAIHPSCHPTLTHCNKQKAIQHLNNYFFTYEEEENCKQQSAPSHSNSKIDFLQKSEV